MRRQSETRTLVLIGATVVLARPSAAFGQAQTKCADLMKLQVPGINLVANKAEWYAAGTPPQNPGPGARPISVRLPAYCRLDATIDPRAGAGGTRYGIRFALALPDDWNGRFLFQGGGGLNGSVLPPYGTTAAGETPGLARGFVVVSTDTGHEGTAAFDASFFADQQASLDFAYIAVGRVAAVSKRIIAEYYRRPAEHSYFAGCSTGGREAMLMTQRYPTFFDGVISGAPAMRTSYSGVGDRWVAVALNQAAPKGADGKPIPSQALSDSDRKLIIDRLLDACDAKDGVKDGLISNTRGCDFDPIALVCKGAKKNDACLTLEQATAVKKGMAGPRDSKGNQVYPGFPYDTGIGASTPIRGVLNPGPGVFGPADLSVEFDVDKAAVAAANPQARMGDTDSWTNLSTFSSRGGRLIFFHGVSDPWFSALDTVDYYERMARANGGAAQAQAWSRLFLVPGMGHCGGGSSLDSFDLLTSVVNWVEKGAPPDSVTGAGRAFPGRSRPMCAYPSYAHYKGSGDPEDAKNFECRN